MGQNHMLLTRVLQCVFWLLVSLIVKRVSVANNRIANLPQFVVGCAVQYRYVGTSPTSCKSKLGGAAHTADFSAESTGMPHEIHAFSGLKNPHGIDMSINPECFLCRIYVDFQHGKCADFLRSTHAFRAAIRLVNGPFKWIFAIFRTNGVREFYLSDTKLQIHCIDVHLKEYSLHFRLARGRLQKTEVARKLSDAPLKDAIVTAFSHH